MADAAVEGDLPHSVVLEGLDRGSSCLQVVVIHEAIASLTALFLIKIRIISNDL